MPEKIKKEVVLEVYEDLESLAENQRNLLISARNACSRAYAPYSNFRVGAAVLLDNNEIILGSNQENAAYPSGLCAERVALFASKTQYPEAGISMIAISACQSEDLTPVGVTPCGSCRQVMVEYQSLQKAPIALIMEGTAGKIYQAQSVDSLLPFKFSFNSSEIHEI